MVASGAFDSAFRARLGVSQALNANHPLSSALVMSRSALANSYVKGTAIAAVVPCAEREARIGQPAYGFPTVRSQATWMFALKPTP
jgi:hypothetical protein